MDLSRPCTTYFDIQHICKLLPTPPIIHGNVSSNGTPASASAAFHSKAAEATPTPSASVLHSRRASGGSGTGSATFIAPVPSYTHASSNRHNLSALSDSRFHQVRLNDRIVPISPYSPRVGIPGIEKLTEEELIHKLVQASEIPVASTKVILPGELANKSSTEQSHHVVQHDGEIPPQPATARNEQHRAFVTYLLRTCTLEDEPTARKETCFATLEHQQQQSAIPHLQAQSVPTSSSSSDSLSAPHSIPSASSSASAAKFDWLRLTPPLDVAIPPSELSGVNAQKSIPPFIQASSWIDDHGNLRDGGLKPVVDLWEIEEHSHQDLSLHSLDVSPGALLAAFRFGVRAALLSCKKRRIFHAQVTLLANACTDPNTSAPSQTRLTDPKVLYSFLKIWTQNERERKRVRKIELKRQLDWLDRHPYYYPLAFGEKLSEPNQPLDRQTKQQYNQWLKVNALALHSQLLQLSEEIHMLKKKSKTLQHKLLSQKGGGGKCVPTGCFSCFSAAGEDDEQDSDSDGELDEELKLLDPEPRFESQANSLALLGGRGTGVTGAAATGPPTTLAPLQPPPELGKRKKFGVRRTVKVKRTTQTNGIPNGNSHQQPRKQRVNGQTRSNGDDVGAETVISSLSADEASCSDEDSDSDDGNYIRTPAEEKARTEYLIARRELERQHEWYRQQLKLRKDTSNLLKDIGLEDPTVAASSNGEVGRGYGTFDNVSTAANGSSASAVSSSTAPPTRMITGMRLKGRIPSTAALWTKQKLACMHRVYAQLAFALMRFQGLESTNVQAGNHGVSSPASASGASNGNSYNPTIVTASSGAPSSSSYQTVHLSTPQLNPNFRPLLSAEKREFLDSFAKLYNVESVWRCLVLLHFLSQNLTNTWASFAMSLDTINTLELLKKSPTIVWTRQERSSYVVYLSRFISWTTNCTANFMFVFQLPIYLRSKEDHTRYKADVAMQAQAQKQQQDDALRLQTTTSNKRESLKDRVKSSLNIFRVIGANGKKDVSQPPTVASSTNGVAAASPSGVQEQKEQASDEEKDGDETEDEDAIPPVDQKPATDVPAVAPVSVRPSLIGSPSPSPPPVVPVQYSLLHPLHPQSSSQTNRSNAAMKSCIDLMHRAWKILQGLDYTAQQQHQQHQALAALCNVAAPTSPRSQASSSIPLPPGSALAAPSDPLHKFRLSDHLAPRIKEAYRRVYGIIVKNAGALARGGNKQQHHHLHGSDDRNDDDHSSAFHSDLHLTLVLHTVLEELSCSFRVGEKWFVPKVFKHDGGGSGSSGSSAYVECVLRGLVKAFWNSSETYICQKRIPAILEARAQAEDSQTDTEQSNRMKEVNLQIETVFDVYLELQWFQFALQPLSSSSSSQFDSMIHSSASLSHRSAMELQSLRKWFVPLVDGFLEAILDKVDGEISKLEMLKGGNEEFEKQMSFPLLLERIDSYTALLRNRPCTLTHKRNLLDSLAKLAKVFVERKIMAGGGSVPAVQPAATSKPSSSASPPLSIFSQTVGGIQIELQCRFQLNQIYVHLYPPLAALGEKEREKQTKKVTEEAAKRKSGGGASAADASATSLAKPAHKFGYDSVLPSLPPIFLLNLNTLRAIVAKQDTLARGWLGTDSLEHRGPHGQALNQLLIQSIGMVAQGLVEVLLPNTIFNLLYSDAPSKEHSSTSPTRWPAAKVEKCFSEFLGFLFGHIDSLKKGKLHGDLLRELGIFIVLEMYEFLSCELRNVTRLIIDGKVYFKRREVSEYPTKEQIHRIAAAMELGKAFVQDVLGVHPHWFESIAPMKQNTILGGGGSGGGNSASGTSTPTPWTTTNSPLSYPSSMARELGLGPYGVKTLAQDPHAMKHVASTGVSSSSSSSSASTNHLSSTTIGLLAPVPEHGPGSTPNRSTTGAVTATPFGKYVHPPGWSSVPFVLCEIWKIEKLLAIMQAPTSVLLSLYDTHTDARTPAERKVAEEKERQSAEHSRSSSFALGLADFAGGDGTPAGRRSGQHTPAKLSISVSHPRHPGLNSDSFTVSASAGVPHSFSSLHIDVATPAVSVLTGQIQILPPSSSASSMSAPPLQTSSTFLGIVDGSNLHHTPAPILAAHPFIATNLSRWEIYRLMQARAKYQDDSGAHEWLSKAKKPDKPKDTNEPPSGLLNKLFGI